MPQMNYMNLADTYGRGERDRQAYEINELAQEAAQQEFDDATRLSNSKWLAAVGQYGLEQDPSTYADLMPAIEAEGKRRGIWPELGFDYTVASPDVIRSGFENLYHQGMTALAGQETTYLRDTDIPSDVRVARWMLEASPEQREAYINAKRTQPNVELTTVQNADGTSSTVLYDPQQGTIYDLDARAMNVPPPGAPGRPAQQARGLPAGGPALPEAPAVEAPQVPSGGLRRRPGAPQQPPGAPQGAQRPEGFGVSPTPYDTARDKAQAAADVAFQQRRGKELDQANTAIQTGYSLMPVMQRALDATSPWTAGKGSIIADIPFFGRGTEAKNLEADLTTIKANIGFDRLQRMRAESPTGGALGQVAVQELVALQATLRSLDQSQSHEQLAGNLQQVMIQYKSWIDAWGEAIAKEGTPDQFDRYYRTIPPGVSYWAPDGTRRTKRAQ